MADLAKYIRIYDPAPDDDAVTKREAAIKDAVATLRKANTSTTALVALGTAAARSFEGGSPPDPLGTVVATAIKSKAPSFVSEGRELETSVISAVAVLEMLEGQDTTSTVSIKDILAATLWSALAHQHPIENPKHEQLRQDLLAAARERSVSRAEISRKRTTFKEIPEVTQEGGEGWQKTLGAARTAVIALEMNSVLDREEINVVWWALGGRSPTTGRAYDRLEPAVRAVVRGLELGSLVRRLPSQSLRSLALANVPEINPLPLSDLLASAEGDIEQIRASIPAQNVVEAHPVAFPLLSALLGGAAAGGEGRTGDQWCDRALLEASLASLCETPNARF